MKTKNQGRIMKYQYILIFMVMLGIFGWAEKSQAATYYAAPKGSLEADNTASGSGTLGDPWSIKSAMANAQAGDTVYFRGGTYQAQDTGTSAPSFYPANSGTSDLNRITFIAYPNETPIINGHIRRVTTGTITAVQLSTLTDNSDNVAYMTDANKDFNILGVRGLNCVRTAIPENVACVRETDPVSADGHTLYFHNRNYYNLTSLNAGDSYEIVKDQVVVLGTGGSETKRDYITFDGFTIQADNGMELGAMSMEGPDSGTNNSVGNIVQNMTFVGPYENRGNEAFVNGENRQFIFIRDNTDLWVKNCNFSNLREVHEWHNTSAIKTYHNINLHFENNEFDNMTVGVYLKSGTDTVSLKNNYVHDCHECIIAHTDSYFQKNGEVSNNIFANCEQAGLLLKADSDTDPLNDWNIHHNTFYSASGPEANGGLLSIGIPPQQYSTGYQIHNNVFQSPLTASGGANVTLQLYGQSYELRYIDYNAYGSPMKVQTRPPGTAFSTYDTTIESWRARESSTLSLVANAHDLHSVGGNAIKFASSNPQNIQDFALASDSPGYQAASDFNGSVRKDMGADVSLVGSSIVVPEDETPPASPSGLLVS